MVRCKFCKVPLSGFLSKISGFLFKVKPSEKNKEVCNKCSDKPLSGPAAKQGKDAEVSEGIQYECKICGRMVHEKHSLEHIKAEEYLIKLIEKDHPQWRHKDPTCPECIEYYRKLIHEAEL